ncbi:uncharacterized protein LOC9658446 [Selaginella moellendorffii]|uniref:uncharacterized protein LOC9658446 n=1 Tax=Selaginella moellendorffii TaxID=88036 RepID=UPI000D1C2A21|nr:uncharacterized protein LOC9658446 [Selaginella moellendorffii]|eukprot:XP_024525721.1 uncharacterized protein LOC9658446 [Selaginella moellendorffii]
MDTCAALEKLYPQVDRRIIRATAIEHKNDLQAGIDFIEGEVLDWKARRSIESTQILDYREFSEAPAMDSTDTDIVDTDNVDENAELVSSDDPGVWKSASSSMYAVDCETIEQMIEQTKTDKQNLMVSIQEMKELRRVAEQAEAAARSAKAQALEGVEALHASAEEVRKTVAEAREANAVHSGEVYGEKAVLGTEARELFSRVQQVRTEWLKASDILEEMKATLQDRIAKAKEDERVADEERLRKEAASRELLQKEEDILAQITQESIELDLEADNCTKLREFLMKQGTVVDSLQGEISILHEDVELLKKKVEGLVLDSFHSASQAGSIFNWQPELISDLAPQDNDDEFAAALSTSSFSHEKSTTSSGGSWQFLETEQ